MPKIIIFKMKIIEHIPWFNMGIEELRKIWTKILKALKNIIVLTKYRKPTLGP